MRTILLLAVLAVVTSSAAAQDMKATDILVDGQGWELVGEGFTFTEGPAVDAKGNLYFTDVFRSKIQRLNAQGKPEVFVDQSYGTNGLKFGPDGRLYGCQNGKQKIVAYDSAAKETVIADDVNSNDLVVTKAGGIYVTDPGHHQVWYIAPGGEKRVVDKGLGYPNGLALTPDQGTLVVADMNDSHLWAFRIETDGSLKFKQPFYTMYLPNGKKDSGADGMCIDAAGRAYVTTHAGLQIFDREGRLSLVLEKPQPAWLSNVVFGGPDFKTLYVTCTSRVYKRPAKVAGVPAYGAAQSK